MYVEQMLNYCTFVYLELDPDQSNTFCVHIFSSSHSNTFKILKRLRLLRSEMSYIFREMRHSSDGP
jgi:hypothetical protein